MCPRVSYTSYGYAYYGYAYYGYAYYGTVLGTRHTFHATLP